MRSKAALLFSLVVKRAGAALWLPIVPELLRFAEQSPAHMRTVGTCLCHDVLQHAMVHVGCVSASSVTSRRSATHVQVCP